jgi:hypothetical protein
MSTGMRDEQRPEDSCSQYSAKTQILELKKKVEEYRAAKTQLEDQISRLAEQADKLEQDSTKVEEQLLAFEADPSFSELYDNVSDDAAKYEKAAALEIDPRVQACIDRARDDLCRELEGRDGLKQKVFTRLTEKLDKETQAQIQNWKYVQAQKEFDDLLVDSLKERFSKMADRLAQYMHPVPTAEQWRKYADAHGISVALEKYAFVESKEKYEEKLWDYWCKVHKASAATAHANDQAALAADAFLKAQNDYEVAQSQFFDNLLMAAKQCDSDDGPCHDQDRGRPGSRQQSPRREGGEVRRGSRGRESDYGNERETGEAEY